MMPIDRTRIPDIHAAARRHRAEYLSCLAKRFAVWVAQRFQAGPAAQTAPCR